MDDLSGFLLTNRLTRNERDTAPWCPVSYSLKLSTRRLRNSLVNVCLVRPAGIGRQEA